MSRPKLPGPGTVGAPASPEHCIAAAERVRAWPGEYTPAYLFYQWPTRTVKGTK